MRSQVAVLIAAGCWSGASGVAAAEHGDPVMIAVPGDGSHVPRNVVVRIESTNGVSFAVSELGARGGEVKAELIATKGASRRRIGLRAVDFVDDEEGGYGDAMVVLEPDGLLPAGAEVELVVSYRHDGAWDPYVLARYRSTGDIDRRGPRWRRAPRKIGRDRIAIDLAGETGLVDVIAEIRPAGRRGRTQRLRVSFDPDRRCGGGPTTSYPVVKARGRCPDLEGKRECQRATEYGMFPRKPGDPRLYSMRLWVEDIAGHRRRAPGKPLTIEWSGDAHFCLDRR
jgi:hypothetical protein